ncbi:hypothetical protein C5167_015445 [Papaver somniferum]|uniref:Uncharacterized protein n=1 Tax=Papaver somniferum TaxID=3469 RepID=A0A4Y7J942_PAPSO|nr:hypothetical protein C5167_015445 [Papaver somniferum]
MLSFVVFATRRSADSIFGYLDDPTDHPIEHRSLPFTTSFSAGIVQFTPGFLSEDDNSWTYAPDEMIPVGLLKYVQTSLMNV